MGTSSSFSGPGNNPLLPDDFNDTSWQSTKAEFGKYLNNSGGDTSRLFGKYVKASGGSKALASKSIGGKAAFISFSNLITQINNAGLSSTLDAFKISSEGKALDEIISILAGNIAPSGNSKEAAVARKATIDTMMFFYELVDDRNLDIEIIDSISGDLFDDLMCEYMTNYITGLLLKDLGYGVEKYIEDPEVLSFKEQELRDFVDSKIYIMLSNSELQKNPSLVVNEVFEATMEIVGGNYE